MPYLRVNNVRNLVPNVTPGDVEYVVPRKTGESASVLLPVTSSSLARAPSDVRSLSRAVWRAR